MPYLTILIVAGCAVFFHRAAEDEDESGILWSGLSLLISLSILFYFQWGWLALMLAQGLLFFGIGVFRALRKP